MYVCIRVSGSGYAVGSVAEEGAAELKVMYACMYVYVFLIVGLL